MLFRLSGAFLFRFADRQLRGLLSQLPPRITPVLNQELAVVAGAIKELLDGRNLDAIAVGEFTGPARAVASGGAGIIHTLIDIRYTR